MPRASRTSRKTRLLALYREYGRGIDFIGCVLFAVAVWLLSEYVFADDITQDGVRHFISAAIACIALFLPLAVANHFRHYSSPVERVDASTKALEDTVAQVRRVTGAFGGQAYRAFLDELFEFYSPKDAPHTNGHEHIARQLFAEDYLDNQRLGISDKTIHMTTDAYTKLYWRLTERLAQLESEARGIVDAPNTEVGKRIGRLHITGMLPEEFFNGPQIVYESEKNACWPRMICHQWQDYPDLYSRNLLDWPTLRVRRYVVVRGSIDSSAVELLGALSTKRDLELQANLVINPNPRNLSAHAQECARVLRRLIRKSPNLSDSESPLRAFFGRIVARHKISYFPIVDREACDGVRTKCTADSKWECLLSHYRDQYHSSKDDCRYCWLDDSVWHSISRRRDVLYDSFRAEHTPEIVLFGDADFSQWYFGVQGFYRPFTRDIEVRFLDGSKTRRLAEEMMAAVQEHQGSFMDLEGVGGGRRCSEQA